MKTQHSFRLYDPLLAEAIRLEGEKILANMPHTLTFHLFGVECLNLLKKIEISKKSLVNDDRN